MKYKLLVAEDVDTERAALCSVLRSHLGDVLTILEATDGSEALALFEQEQPEIAILNIEMPSLSGLEVAQEIRSAGYGCSLLFISDLDNFSYAKQAIALRALDYILKPFDESKLIQSVKDAIRDSIRFSAIPHPRTINFNDNSEVTRLALVREDIISFIDSHFMEELSMKNAARALNYSDAYFCKLFKQCFHTNFSTYLNEYRIQKAQEMMHNPRVNIKDISLNCGYTDANYFSRVFKRITGQTPTEYRLTILEKALKN